MRTKVIAVIEVVIVFGLTMGLMALVILSPIGEWERQVTEYPFIEYAVMIAVPLLLLVITRRKLTAYGLSFHNISYHLNIALTAFVPAAIALSFLAFVNYKQWMGALLMAVVQIALLFVLGWLLRKKPTQNENNPLAGSIILIAYSSLLQKGSFGYAISGLVFYLLFLAFGEELLFRGYIQSRLNIAWGRPFQFYGVNWGWGLIITCVIFGLMHVINLYGFLIGDWHPMWAWGFWTFFGGLVFGFIREKTGSIFASTLLHGLPQGIYTAFFGG